MAGGDNHTPQQEQGGFHLRYIIHATLTLLVLLALLSHDPADSAVLSGGSGDVPKNLIGYTGAWLSFWAFTLFGLAAYLIEALLVLRTLRRFTTLPPPQFSQSGNRLLSYSMPLKRSLWT